MAKILSISARHKNRKSFFARRPKKKRNEFHKYFSLAWIYCCLYLYLASSFNMDHKPQFYGKNMQSHEIAEIKLNSDKNFIDIKYLVLFFENLKFVVIIRKI